MTVTPETLPKAREAYRLHMLMPHHRVDKIGLQGFDARYSKLINELKELGFSAIEAYCFAESGGTADIDEIARLIGYAQPAPNDTNELTITLPLARCGICKEWMVKQSTDFNLRKYIKTRYAALKHAHHNHIDKCEYCVEHSPDFKLTCENCSERYPIEEMMLERREIVYGEYVGESYLCKTCGKQGEALVDFLTPPDNGSYSFKRRIDERWENWL